MEGSLTYSSIAEKTLRWDRRFLDLAKHISAWSKDRTKVGAIIVRPDKTIASLGFNGFPRRLPDDPELLANRTEKLKRVVHAEMNAILHTRELLLGYSLYTWPFPPCVRCACHILQTGIYRIICPSIPPERMAADDPMEIPLAVNILRDAGIEVVEFGG